MNETEIFYPTSRTAWKKWLEKNHLSKQSVWLVFHTQSSGKPSLTWSDAVDIALCFGWIDSKKIKMDATTSHQFFSRRKAQSTWSKINKDKVQQLIENGLMTPTGYASIEIAKQNGSWTLLDEVEKLIIPPDLEDAFGKHRGSKDYFLGLSRSIKKMMLAWIVMAKRPETRQNRISEIAVLAGQHKRPKQF
jgi:uncharacterized protein YdeI (YjbR/CyaY-like superfamily)